MVKLRLYLVLRYVCLVTFYHTITTKTTSYYYYYFYINLILYNFYTRVHTLDNISIHTLHITLYKLNITYVYDKI